MTLDEIKAKLHTRHEAAMNELADIIVAGVREDISEAYPPASSPGNPPHSRTGNLLRGVGQETQRDAGAVTATIFSNREGGNPAVPIFLEHGTSRMEDRPYMTPAKDEWADKGPALYADLIRAHSVGG